jgi:hypothetical protein
MRTELLLNLMRLYANVNIRVGTAGGTRKPVPLQLQVRSLVTPSFGDCIGFGIYTIIHVSSIFTGPQNWPLAAPMVFPQLRICSAATGKHISNRRNTCSANGIVCMCFKKRTCGPLSQQTRDVGLSFFR